MFTKISAKFGNNFSSKKIQEHMCAVGSLTTLYLGWHVIKTANEENYFNKKFTREEVDIMIATAVKKTLEEKCPPYLVQEKCPDALSFSKKFLSTPELVNDKNLYRLTMR